MAKAERSGIRRPARFGDQLRLERGPWRWHPRGLAGGRSDVGREQDFHLCILRDRAAGAGKDAAEGVDLFSHAGAPR
jgi:hypothetical protein